MATICDLLGGAFLGSDGEFHAAGMAQQQAAANYVIRTYFDPITNTERREYWQAGLAVSSDELRHRVQSAALNALATTQQQASADRERRQYDGAMNALRATPEQIAETERYYATRRHVEEVRAEHAQPDRWFWYWLAGMTAAAALWRIIALAWPST